MRLIYIYKEPQRQTVRIVVCYFAPNLFWTCDKPKSANQKTTYVSEQIALSVSENTKVVLILHSSVHFTFVILSFIPSFPLRAFHFDDGNQTLCVEFQKRQKGIRERQKAMIEFNQ